MKHYEIQHNFFIICQPGTWKIILSRLNLRCKSFYLVSEIPVEFCQIQCSAKSENSKKVFTANN